jgi:mannose-6-phosphate isomerase class I
VLSGQGVITVNNNRQEFKAGDSFFVTAGHKNVRISGNCDVIVTRV